MSGDRRTLAGSVEYSNPWFEVVAKRHPEETEPYFSLRMSDYVTVVALTQEREFVLVRQYRPAVEEYTLELPAGMVEAGEAPEAAGLRELEEETGFTATRLEALGSLHSDTGRNENRVWCYLAADATPLADWTPEPGLEVVRVAADELHELILREEFSHALNLAALMKATLRRQRSLPSLFSAPTVER